MLGLGFFEKEYLAERVEGEWFVRGDMKKKDEVGKKLEKEKGLKKADYCDWIGDDNLYIFVDGAWNAFNLYDDERGELDYAEYVNEEVGNGGVRDIKQDVGFVNYRTWAEYRKAVDNMGESFIEFEESDEKIIGEGNNGGLVEYDIRGDYLDVGRFLEGENECFGNVVGGKVENKFVKIIVEEKYYWSVRKGEVNSKVSKILRLVDLLERNGYRVELWLLKLIDIGVFEIRIKRYEDKLDIGGASLVLSIDFYRKSLFEWIETNKNFGWDYGMPRNASRGLIEKIGELNEGENILYINGEVGLEEERKIEELEKKVVENANYFEEEKLVFIG